MSASSPSPFEQFLDELVKLIDNIIETIKRFSNQAQAQAQNEVEKVRAITHYNFITGVVSNQASPQSFIIQPNIIQQQAPQIMPLPVYISSTSTSSTSSTTSSNPSTTATTTVIYGNRSGGGRGIVPT